MDRHLDSSHHVPIPLITLLLFDARSRRLQFRQKQATAFHLSSTDILGLASSPSFLLVSGLGIATTILEQET